MLLQQAYKTDVRRTKHVLLEEMFYKRAFLRHPHNPMTAMKYAVARELFHDDYDTAIPLLKAALELQLERTGRLCHTTLGEDTRRYARILTLKISMQTRNLLLVESRQ